MNDWKELLDANIHTRLSKFWLDKYYEGFGYRYYYVYHYDHPNFLAIKIDRDGNLDTNYKIPDLFVNPDFKEISANKFNLYYLATIEKISNSVKDTVLSPIIKELQKARIQLQYMITTNRTSLDNFESDLEKVLEFPEYSAEEAYWRRLWKDVPADQVREIIKNYEESENAKMKERT